MKKLSALLLAASALCATGAQAQTVFTPVNSASSVISGCGTSDTQVLFTNGTQCGGSANFTWSSPALTLGKATSTTGQLKLTGATSGTITITGVAAAGTYNFNLPITAGSAGNFLTSQGGSGTAMTWTAAPTSATAANIGAACGTDTQVVFVDSTSCAGSAGLVFSKGNAGTTSQLTIGGNARLLGEATNVLAMRNSTTAQTARVYNTFTDASNYERGIFDWAGTANVLSVGTQSAGSGTTRNMQFLVGGANKLDFGVTTASIWTAAVRVAAPNLQAKTVYSAAGTALPTCDGAAEGTLASVSDATAPAYGDTYTSGGTVHSRVYCDGTNWKDY